MNFNEIAQSALDAPFRAQQKRTELAQVLEFLAPRGLKNILEIGVMKGGTIKAWTQIADSWAQIIGIDLPGGEYGGGFDKEWEIEIKNLALETQNIILFSLDSHLDSTFKTVVEYGLFDFIFIDADHTYEGVKKDFFMYSSLVKPGGLIGLHDILEYPKTTVPIEVHIFWDELKKRHPAEKTYEFIDLDYPSDHGQWGGIGIIEL